MKITKMLAALAATVGLVSGAQAARTVAVSQMTDSAVTLAFGGADNLDYELFVASGTTDGGDDKRAWTTLEKVADIAYDQTSYTYAVPATLRDGRYLRFFLMQTKGIACAKELKSVRSTGAQSIDTGITPNNRTVVDFQFGDVAYVNQTAFFGGNWNASCYLLNQQSNKFWFHGAGGLSFTLLPTANTDYRCVIRDNNYLYLSVTPQGGSTTTYSSSVSRANNNVGGSMRIFSSRGGNYATFRFDRMRIANCGTLQRDFIPALDANGVAGLYDQVDNTFYKSCTTTALVAGEAYPQDRFGRVIDQTSTFRFHRSLTLTDLTADTATFTFGNPDGAEYTLFFAAGATDGASRKAAWTTFAEIATIAADQTTYTHTFTAEQKSAGAYRRFFLLKTTDLPYTQELASLTATGAQRVSLDYIPSSKTVLSFDFGARQDGSITFFGQHWNSYVWLLDQQNTKILYFHGTGSLVAPQLVANTDYHVDVRDDDTFAITANGEAYGTYAQSRQADPFTPFMVFACYQNDCPGKFRFDALRLWEKALPVANLMPVVANGKGALYDHVTGKVYANLTGTDFTRGTALDASRVGQIVDETTTLRLDGLATAEWTGAGDVTNFSDPANWTCRTAAGAVVADGVPARDSTVTLAADADWSAFTAAVIPTKVALAGHTLKVPCAALPEVTGAGTLDIMVPAGQTFTANRALCLAETSLAKSGAGTILFTTFSQQAASITVKDGIAKLGGVGMVRSMMPVTVEKGGAFDMNGCKDTMCVFTLAGDGPDGAGALRNTGGDIGSGSAQIGGITLSDDASCSGNTFGMVYAGYNGVTMNLNGHTFTISLTTGKWFWMANVSGSTEGTLHLKNGGFCFFKKATDMSSTDVIVDGANSSLQVNSDAGSIAYRNITLVNGGACTPYKNCLYAQKMTVLDNSRFPSASVVWIYLDALVVSNETSDITIPQPICNWHSYPQLVKQGAGKLTLANNYQESRMDSGLDLQGGTVVMSSTHTTKNYHYAISSQAHPDVIHAGTTLDMTQCGTDKWPQLSALTIEDGGTLKHTADQTICFAKDVTFKPYPNTGFTFSGTVRFPNYTTTTFDVTDLFAGDNPPAKGSTTVLFQPGGKITGRCRYAVTGCPYDYFLEVTDTAISLVTRSDEQVALEPLKFTELGDLMCLGRANADGTTVCYRNGLGAALEKDGFNMLFTGWRSGDDRLPGGAYQSVVRWRGLGSVDSLALKTSPTRAGVLEGLEAYCAAANEPDFLLLALGNVDVQDGVADDTIFANYTNAVSRIRSALPMTTVLAGTIPDASAALNTRITDWAATQTEVEAVDLAACLTTNTTAKAITQQYTEMIAALKAKIEALATPEGKKTPTVWTRPAVRQGVTNNVPAAYWQGFQRAAVLDVPASITYTQSQGMNDELYTVSPTCPRTGIAKAGYYVELIHGTTGAMQAIWIDMDAPGSTWHDISFPALSSQWKQQPVTKLHVWSNTRAVTCVPPTDDSVTGFVEFNMYNYSQPEQKKDGWITEPWSNAFGFDDTLGTSGSSGHGSFQFMRKFADSSVFPNGEILFTLTRWAGEKAGEPGIGIGTLANYGKHGWTTSLELDRTFCYGSSAGGLAASSWSLRRIEFWVKYGDTPGDRASCADAVWANNGDTTLWQFTNWVTSAGTAVTSFDYCTWLIPEGTDVSFSYLGYDNITHWGTTFIIDGKVTMPTSGGFYNNQITVGPKGVLSFDPTEFAWHVRAAPVFEDGGKFALPAKYANNTKGKFLLFTVDRVTDDMTNLTYYANAFDTTSAKGTNPKMYIERLANSTVGYVWLDLAYGAARETMNVLCMGDSITHGSDGSYGNWRTHLAKKIEALGYNANMKGFRRDESKDINGCVVPEAWTRHAGLGGQRIISGGGAGTIDAVENTIDQAGDCDFILVKLGTNDICGNTPEATLFPVWSELMTKILAQNPHAKVVAGAVVDIAYNATLNAVVTNFNAHMKRTIEDGATFPAGRIFFSDLYTPCYRYDAEGNYITGSFYAWNNVHPDWPGEVKMAETYLATMTNALAHADADWSLNAHGTYPATTGCENNVPAAERAGFKRAAVLDLVANNGTVLSDLGYVPYTTDGCDATAATENLSRVGYYIEYTRKDAMGSTYDGLTRWMWISADAFGGRSLADVGVPLTTVHQDLVKNARVKTNMPGISDTADGATETLWAEFWPSSYGGDACTSLAAPNNTWTFDWSDSRGDNMAGYGSMQLHRFLPAGSRNPAQVLFAFNAWTCADTGGWCFGLGNFACQSSSTMDWTWIAKYFGEAFGLSQAYTTAKIEIWTLAPDEGAIKVDRVEMDGTTATVAGTVVDLGANATNTTVVLEWSATEDFATVAGSSDVGTVDAAGTITGTATGLAAGQSWYFRFRATNSETAETTSTVVASSAFVWRPTAADATWHSLAWLLDSAGSPVAFTAGGNAYFDGSESTKVAAVAVTNAVTANFVQVDGARDYTLSGAGSVTAEKFVKKGTGTLTLDNAVLGATKDLEIEAGIVKLGDSATRGAVGSDVGTVTIRNGAQFDMNYNDTGWGHGRARALVTSAKKFVIVGDGPDGKGALTTTFAGASWGSELNEIVLAGDASIGGIGRLCLRGNAKNTITGPTNATLTIRNTDASGINIHGLTSVGKVVIAEGATYLPEGNSASFVVPQGIDLAGQLMMFNSSASWNVGGIQAVGTKGVIQAASSSSAINTSVTVPEGTALTLNGSSTENFNGAITNAGTITTSSGTQNFNAPYVGAAGSVHNHTGGNEFFNNTATFAGMTHNHTGGSVYFRPNGQKVSGTLTANVNNVMYWLNGNGDYSDLDLTVNLSRGSSLVLGENNYPGTGIPNVPVDQLHINALAGHTGNVFFHVSAESWSDGLTVNGKIGGGFYSQGPSGASVTVHASNLTVEAGNVYAGTSARSEFEVTGSNTVIKTDMLRVDAGNKSAYNGAFSFADGLLELGANGISLGWNHPERPSIVLKSGTVRATANLSTRNPGMTASFGTPQHEGALTIDLNGKTVKWSTGLTGASDVTIKGAGTFTMDREGIQGIPTGLWTIESTGTVDLRNAAGFAKGLTLADGANVTLDIVGTNRVEMRAWTWDGNAWNTMRGIYASAPAQHVVTSLAYVNRPPTQNVRDNQGGSGTGINYLGQFYVSAERAGKWYFAHNGATHSGILIDGTELDTLGPNGGGIPTKELTEGWHDFMLSTYNGGNTYWGPNTGCTTAQKENLFWFKVGGKDAGSWPADYQAFDMPNVPMRMRQNTAARTSVRCRYVKTYGNSGSQFDTMPEHSYTSDTVLNSLVPMHTYYKTGVNAPYGACSTRWDGYFYVSKVKEGTWTFYGKYDDGITARIDGRKIVAASGQSGSLTLLEGWHRFEIRTADNTAANVTNTGSGGTTSDRYGNVSAFMFQVNNEGAWTSFDERSLSLALTAGDAQKIEEAGLGGTTTVGAGATLANQVRDGVGAFCPIRGTLAGTGTLTGPFRFVGEDATWSLTGTHNRKQIAATAFENADPETLAGLRNLAVTFNQKPGCRTYTIGDALGLTAETAAAISFTAVDAAGNDLTEYLALTVQQGKLVIANARPSGVVIIFR